MDATNPVELAVHDVNIKDISRLQLNGQIAFFKQLTFYVGTHGPFMKEWPTANFDANLAKKVMQDQVQELRLITAP
jgi:hypothetical protein